METLKLTREDVDNLIVKFARTYTKLLPLIDERQKLADDKLKQINAYERFEDAADALQVLRENLLYVLASLTTDNADLAKMYGDYLRFVNDKGEWMTMGYKFNLHYGEEKPVMFEIIIRDDVKPEHSDPLGIGMR